jgi:hypothetical protein
MMRGACACGGAGRAAERTRPSSWRWSSSCREAAGARLPIRRGCRSLRAALAAFSAGLSAKRTSSGCVPPGRTRPLSAWMAAFDCSIVSSCTSAPLPR